MSVYYGVTCLRILYHIERAYDEREVVRDVRHVVDLARNEDGVSYMTVSSHFLEVLDIPHHISVVFRHNIVRWLPGGGQQCLVRGQAIRIRKLASTH
jgi:hypothetical protein